MGNQHDAHLLRFLVTLINRIGVPVMLIGTTDAVEVIGATARLARRGTGQGSAIWERYEEDHAEWIAFIDDLWQYQWTNVHTELSPKLRERFYHHSQGIIDLAIKLFMLTQMRAIRLGEVTLRLEYIKEALLDVVAKEEMTLVQPLLKALRTGNRTEIKRYSDLTSLSDQVAKLIRSDIGSSKLVLPRAQHSPQGSAVKDQEMTDDEQKFAQIFRELGIAPDVGNDLLKDILAAEPEAGFFQIIDLLRDALKAPAPKKNRSSRKSNGRAVIPMPDGDLRAIVADGLKNGRTPHMSLSLAGLAGPVSYFRDPA